MKFIQFTLVSLAITMLFLTVWNGGVPPNNTGKSIVTDDNGCAVIKAAEPASITVKSPSPVSIEVKNDSVFFQSYPMVKSKFYVILNYKN